MNISITQNVLKMELNQENLMKRLPIVFPIVDELVWSMMLINMCELLVKAVQTAIGLS
jgi:hypothetical protein